MTEPTALRGRNTSHTLPPQDAAALSPDRCSFDNQKLPSSHGFLIWEPFGDVKPSCLLSASSSDEENDLFKQPHAASPEAEKQKPAVSPEVKDQVSHGAKEPQREVSPGAERGIRNYIEKKYKKDPNKPRNKPRTSRSEYAREANEERIAQGKVPVSPKRLRAIVEMTTQRAYRQRRKDGIPLLPRGRRSVKN